MTTKLSRRPLRGAAGLQPRQAPGGFAFETFLFWKFPGHSTEEGETEGELPARRVPTRTIHSAAITEQVCVRPVLGAEGAVCPREIQMPRPDEEMVSELEACGSWDP